MKGRTPWGFSELMRIATWLDISLHDLLGDGLINAKAPVRGADEGLSEKLPQLDSNQQPLDFRCLGTGGLFVHMSYPFFMV